MGTRRSYRVGFFPEFVVKCLKIIIVDSLTLKIRQEHLTKLLLLLRENYMPVPMRDVKALDRVIHLFCNEIGHIKTGNG